MRVVPNSKPAYMWVKPTTAAAAAPAHEDLKSHAVWTRVCRAHDGYH
jgi:hypothetical protein